MSETLARALTDSGRALDVQVAIALFGAVWEDRTPAGRNKTLVDATGLGLADWDGRSLSFRGYQNTTLRKFSTDIAAAWQVVEKMRELQPKASGGFDKFEFMLNRYEQSGQWVCQVAADPNGDWSTMAKADADTAPLAICRAALAFMRLFVAHGAKDE